MDNLGDTQSEGSFVLLGFNCEPTLKEAFTKILWFHDEFNVHLDYWCDTRQESHLPGILISKLRVRTREGKIQQALLVLAESSSKQSPHIRVDESAGLLFGLVYKARSVSPYIIFDPGPYLDYAKLHTLAVFIIANNYNDCICSTCLNYVTSLHFVIGIGVTVSCAIPYLFKAQELLAKDNNGFLGPYYTLFHLEPNGNLEFDLPMIQLEELFIVSQEHPHVASFLHLHKFDRAYGGTFVNNCVDKYLSDYNETFGGKCAAYIVLASNHKDKIHTSKRQHKVLEFVRTIQAVCVILGMDFFGAVIAIRSSLTDPTGVQSQSLFTNTLSSLGFTFYLTKSFQEEFPHEEMYWWTVVNQPNFYKLWGYMEQVESNLKSAHFKVNWEHLHYISFSVLIYFVESSPTIVQLAKWVSPWQRGKDTVKMPKHDSVPWREKSDLLDGKYDDSTV